jgi:hypothetical protein
LDNSALRATADDATSAKRIIDDARNLNRRFQAVHEDTGQWKQDIDKLLELQKDKRLIAHIMALVHEAMPDVAPELANAQSPAQLKQLIEANPGRFGRTQRKQLIIESLNISYVPNIEEYDAGGSSRSGGGGWNNPFGEGGGAIMGGGSGRFAGGGRGRMGFVEAPSQPREEATTSEGAGFYVHIDGKLLYGEELSKAASVLTEEYFPRLKQLGQRPGLGFHVMNKDPKSDDGLNIRLREIRKYYGEGTTGAVAGGRLGARGARGARAGVMAAGVPGAGGEGDSRTAELRDPVTDEPITTDWRFDMGFKIKLGEMPADEDTGEPGSYDE